MKRHLLTLLVLAAAVAAGCGGGGSGGSSGSIASINSNQQPAPVGSNTAPTNSSTTAAAVSATLALNQFAAFKELNSIVDMAAPASVQNRIFALEDKGFVRVLDVSGAKPVLDRQIPIDATAPFSGGVSAGSLTIVDAHSALATASGKEAVYLFDPTTAKTAADVTKIDMTPVTANFTTAQTNSKGKAVASPMPLTFTASATLSKGRLFVASSNLDASFDYNPGTIVSFTIDPVTKALSNGLLIVTSSFDPTRLTRYVGPSGEEALLCVNAGANGATASSIDVIDPTRGAIVGTINLPSGHFAGGAVAITPDGKKGYVASPSAAEVFEIDLTNFAAVVASNVVQDLSSRLAATIALPAGPGLNFIAGIGVSASGSYVYATNYNTSSLAIVDTAARKVVGTLSGFQRNGDPVKFECNASALVVRPGAPGLTFNGPSVFVATIGLDVLDRTVPSVTSALDGVSFDKN